MPTDHTAPSLLDALLAAASEWNGMRPGYNASSEGPTCTGPARPVAAHGTPYAGCNTRFGGVRAMTRRYEDNVHTC